MDSVFNSVYFGISKLKVFLGFSASFYTQTKFPFTITSCIYSGIKYEENLVNSKWQINDVKWFQFLLQ